MYKNVVLYIYIYIYIYIYMFVRGAEDADNVFLQKQIEYSNRLIQEGKELEKQVAEVKKRD